MNPGGVLPPLTPLSSISVEFLCLPLGFFTNSFSQEAWSSFSMLFPALITLTETKARRKGEMTYGARSDHMKTKSIPERRSESMDGAGCTRVSRGTGRRGRLSVLYYEPLPEEHNGFWSDAPFHSVAASTSVCAAAVCAG